MYKVMLVDDEYLDLLGLERFVPWSEYDMEVVAAVKSGFEAEQILRHQAVDLLVTDIRMPIMTGLELAELAKVHYPHLKIIFVSGHQDFQYAKQALAMHASGYVLKPIADAELLQQVRLVKLQLEQDRQWRGQEILLSQSLPLVKKQILHQWFQGLIDARSAFLSLDQNDLLTGMAGETFAIVLFEIDDVAWKLKDYTHAERKELVQKAFQLIYQAIDQHDSGIYCNPSEHRVALLSRVTANALYFENVIKQVTCETPLSVTIGMGLAVKNLDDIPLSYQQATRALASKMFLGKGKCLLFEPERHELALHVVSLEKKFETLLVAIGTYTLPEIHDILEDLFGYIANVHNKVSVYNFVLFMLSKLDVYLHSFHVSLDTFLGTPLFNLDILYAFETIDDIKTWLDQNICNISEYLYQRRQKRGSRLIQDIEQYIGEHLGESVSLRDAAQHFGFSPNYLGFVFKEETGETFTEYVNRKRLEKAADLLKNPKLRLHQVAHQLGYSNLTYFGRQFKDFFGQTPGEFRKQL